MLCWLKYDEKNVGQYSLQLYKGSHPAHDDYSVYPGVYSYKYPKAGQDNSKMSAWSYDIKSHRTQKLQVPLDADGYMPRIVPTPNADKVLVYTMPRHQDVLNLYAVNPRSTVAHLLLKESVAKYVKEETMVNLKIGDNYILVPSDRDGNNHIYAGRHVFPDEVRGGVAARKALDPAIFKPEVRRRLGDGLVFVLCDDTVEGGRLAGLERGCVLAHHGDVDAGRTGGGEPGEVLDGLVGVSGQNEDAHDAAACRGAGRVGIKRPQRLPKVFHGGARGGDVAGRLGGGACRRVRGVAQIDDRDVAEVAPGRKRLGAFVAA